MTAGAGRVLILGDISGIQRFVTNVASVGGGQAKRLRARSFYVQLLCDAAALKILDALGVKTLDGGHVLMSAAGHFVLRVADDPGCEEALARQEAEMNAWLLSELAGEVRLSLAWSSGGDSEMARFLLAHRGMNRSTLRPWASVVAGRGTWDEASLVLAPRDKPCQLCGRRKGEIDELLENGDRRSICRLCDKLKQVGEKLTGAERLIIAKPNSARPSSNAWISAFGLNVGLGSSVVHPSDTLAIASLGEPIPEMTNDPFAGRRLTRPLARHVPAGETGHATLDFHAIAGKSTGDHKLGVFKADGDDMGAFWTSIFEADQDLTRYCALSKEFDDFSAGEVDGLIARPAEGRGRWRFIYTIYSGGDDLLYLGPWDVVLDFAAEVRRLFRLRFSRHGLSLSAGIAVVKPGWPIRRVAQLAEDLLEQAKTTPAPGAEGPKDQVAALGSVWKWDGHQGIIDEGKQWASWVRSSALDRGWLQRVRELNEARTAFRRGHAGAAAGGAHGLMASARLSYSIDRLVQSHDRTLRSPRTPENLRVSLETLGVRLKHLVEEFEAPETPRSRHLSASLLYAILSTRSPGAEDRDGMV